MAVTPTHDDAIRTGDTWTFPVYFKDLDTREPVNVSGWSFADPEFREYGQQDDPVIATGTLDVSDAVNGVIIMLLDADSTTAMRTRFKRVGTDLQQTAPTLHTWVEVLCDVDPDFTRP